MNNIAHRGGCGDAPENTLAAFRKALADGRADWVELDVQRSSDGELFVVHDNNLQRTSDVARHFPDRTQAAVGTFTAAELRTLDCGAWFEDGRFAGERMPTLDDVLELLGGKLGIMLEFKNSAAYPDIESQVALAIRSHKLHQSALLEAWSFDIEVLERFAPLCPGVRLGAFTRNMAELQLARRTGLLHGVGVYPEVSPADMVLAGHHGLAMVASTLNTPERIRKALGMGITRIITDYPWLLDEVLHDSPAHAPPSDRERA